MASSYIPYGTVISYKERARRVGRPKGFQAVGQANRFNPLPILIPCHRVVAADGSLGGYAGGLELKEFLLNLEGARNAGEIEGGQALPLCLQAQGAGGGVEQNPLHPQYLRTTATTRPKI